MRKKRVRFLYKQIHEIRENANINQWRIYKKLFKRAYQEVHWIRAYVEMQSTIAQKFEKQEKRRQMSQDRKAA